MELVTQPWRYTDQQAHDLVVAVANRVVQRRETQRLAKAGVGTMRQQRCDKVPITAASSHHQRAEAALATGIGIGPPFQKGHGCLPMPAVDGVHEGRPPVGAAASEVDVSAPLNQGSHGRDVIVARSQHERRKPAFIGRISGNALAQ
jgi:hypothetical protein